MQFFTLLIALAVVAVLASAGKVTLPGRSNLPSVWEKVSEKLSPDYKLHLRIALYPKNAQLLEKTLLDVATPGSANFRKYLQKNEITEIVGRDDSEIQRIRSFVATHGMSMTSVHANRDWVFVDATVAQVEKLFECQLATYVNKRFGLTRVAAIGGYSIPAEMSDIVKFVAGMTTFSFGRWTPITVNEESGPSQYQAVTPQTIYDNYKVPHTGSHGSKLGSQAVIEVGNMANFNDADLQTFFTKYQTQLKGETVGMACTEKDGCSANNGAIRASVEANLDVQYMMASGVFVNTTDYKLVGSSNIEDVFLDYTIMVNGQTSPPLVHSISYGEYGGSYDNTTDWQFSYELQKMGLSGISVLLASGDNGVGCDSKGTTQEFDYPSSPYITMVGATQIEQSGKETGATLSSGGFSKDFMVADWQKSAVDAYFATNPKMPHEDFFRDGRAYPDVAAYGQNVQVIAQGSTTGVAGTSCSAPIFGDIVAFLNDELMRAGKAPLGFLNPWLYAHPEMFTDITEGSNPYQKCDGFYAAKGWDPVTGMGTPLYPQMKTAAFNDAK